jgi:hypothetical protein
LCLILQTNLDQLEGNDDERLGGTSGSAGEDGETLGHLGDAEEITVELAPLVVCGKLGCSESGQLEFTQLRAGVATSWELP